MMYIRLRKFKIKTKQKKKNVFTVRYYFKFFKKTKQNKKF